MKFTLLTLISLIFVLVISGCGQGSPSFSIVPGGDTFKQNAASFNNQLDILWVVDNSGSMGPLQTNMVNNFNSFIQSFETKGYDYRMAVTTTDAFLADSKLNGYNSAYANWSLFRDGANGQHSGVFIITPSTPNLNNTFVTNATQGANGDGDERAFSSLRQSMNDVRNPAFLRSTSYFAIIILSDEDDFSSEQRVDGSWTLQTNNPNYVPDHDYSYANLDTVASYENYLDGLTTSTGATRRWNVSAITVMDNTCLQNHVNQSPSTVIGQRYMQMANDTQGILGSVCDTSYSTSLNNIASQIATLSTQFFLNEIPQVNTIVVVVNGATVPQSSTNGWSYNSAANSVQFHGTAIPAQGATINVSFVPTNGHNG